jgi:hypothetical protein
VFVHGVVLFIRLDDIDLFRWQMFQTSFEEIDDLNVIRWHAVPDKLDSIRGTEDFLGFKPHPRDMRITVIFFLRRRDHYRPHERTTVAVAA